MGVEVTVVEYMPNIVPVEDIDVSKQLEKTNLLKMMCGKCLSFSLCFPHRIMGLEPSFFQHSCTPTCDLHEPGDQVSGG